MFARVAFRALCCGACLLHLANSPVRSAGDETSVEPRVLAGKISSKQGTLIHRAAPGATWQVVPEGEGVKTRDLLMALPGTKAAIEAADGNIRLELLGNLPAISDTPLLESAVVLHDSKAYDLDFTLARGRVTLTNTRRDGVVKVWARLSGDVAWEIRLLAKGDQVALELASRWAPGVPFRRAGDATHRPTRAVVLNVLKGNAELKTGDTTRRLSAPPGAAYFQWDSLVGAESPQRRESLPAWAAEDALKKLPVPLQTQIDQLGPSLDQATVEASLLGFLKSADRQADGPAARHRRELAIYALGAVDQLGAVYAALADAANPASRDQAVLALRQWVGRDGAQDPRLFSELTRVAGYDAGEAEALLHLLHSPFAADQPETFDTLIAYLRHSRPQIRELARWHLYALAPAGKAIPYDSTASDVERKKAYDAWKKLVPSGKLPPAVKP